MEVNKRGKLKKLQNAELILVILLGALAIITGGVYSINYFLTNSLLIGLVVSLTFIGSIDYFKKDEWVRNLMFVISTLVLITMILK